MAEAIVIFNYKNEKTNVSCATSDKMITICDQKYKKI